MMTSGGTAVRFVRQYWPVLLIVAAIGAYAVWYYSRGKPDTTGVPFAVPDAGLTVRFPRPDPETADLSTYLIADDRPGGADRREEVRLFLAAGGRIRSWSQTAGLNRFAIRIHEPPPVEAEQVKRQTAELLSAQVDVGPVVSNMPVVEERLTTVAGKPGRVVLFDAGGRRVLTMMFVADGKLVFLFVERAGADLDMGDPNAAACFGSVEFPPK
jgi:predicted regulator of Ras-like GTPase activity (Roadblock/LC7/MglB family)